MDTSKMDAGSIHGVPTPYESPFRVDFEIVCFHCEPCFRGNLGAISAQVLLLKETNE